MPQSVTGAMSEYRREIGGQTVQVYGIDATPALCVVHAMIEFVPRPPALVVAGINFGENVSTEITISGTVGAALEAAAFGVPALAICWGDGHRHLTGSGRRTTAQRSTSGTLRAAVCSTAR